MPDSFHVYLKKQLLDYVENERKKGVPLAEIEKILLHAGHDKNIIDEVLSDLKIIDSGKQDKIKNPVEKDVASMLKDGFAMFMAKSKEKDIDAAKKDIENTDTEAIVKEVIEEAEIIEEKTVFEGVAFFLYLLALGAIIIVATGATDSQIVNVALGFAPAILSVFISFLALPMADNVPVYVFIPVIISSIFYAVGKFANIGLFQGLEMEALSLVNFVLAFIFNIMIVYVRFLKPNSMRQRIVHKNKGKGNLAEKNGGVGIVTHAKRAERKEIEEIKKEFMINDN